MFTLQAAELQDLMTRIFDAGGSPHDESAWVAETMTRSNLMGCDSHGLARLPMYVDRLLSGQLVPGAPFEVEREAAAFALVNAHQGWGQVAARRAMELCISKARQAGIATVAVRNSQHAGRIGEWAEMAAREEMVGLVFVNSRGGPGSVAPWGGIDRRLTTNPVAFAAPTGREHLLSVDLCMSGVPEGKVLLALHRGEQLPEHCLLTSDGQPTTDPAAWFGDPPGALLTLGGVLGHKGYALDVMVDLLAGALTRAGVSGQTTPTGNGLLCQVFDIAAFLPVADFIAAVEDLRACARSSRRAPGVEEILLPGEPEYRTMQRRQTEGIPIAEATWEATRAAAARVGVEV